MAKLQYMYFSHFDHKNTTPGHQHPCYELIYYTTANCKSSYQTTDHQALDEIDFSHDIKKSSNKLYFSNNTFVIFPPNILHNEVAESGSSTISVGFIPEEEAEMQLMQYVSTCNQDNDFVIYKYIKKLKKEFIEKQHGYRVILDCLLTELLVTLSRKTIGKTMGVGIDYVVRYFDEYYMTDIDIDNFSKMSGFSPSRFRELFKKRMGLSPKQYILTKRLEHIKEDLEKTQIPLTQIATDNGFSDYYQFSAFFKKQTGFSPREYRNSNRPKSEKA